MCSACFNAAQRATVETRLEGQAVRGVALLDNHLYVLREKSSEQIELYDVESFHLLRSLTVPGLGMTVDVVACGHNRYVYVSDTSLKCVHRAWGLVCTRACIEITRWSVKNRPAGLSLTIKHNLLVTCRYAGKVKEFTADGQLLGVVALSYQVRSPWHSVQLSSGALVVCHGFLLRVQRAITPSLFDRFRRQSGQVVRGTKRLGQSRNGHTLSLGC